MHTLLISETFSAFLARGEMKILTEAPHHDRVKMALCCALPIKHAAAVKEHPLQPHPLASSYTAYSSYTDIQLLSLLIASNNTDTLPSITYHVDEDTPSHVS